MNRGIVCVLLAFAMLAIMSTGTKAMGMPGGFTDVLDATSEIQKLADLIKLEAMKECGGLGGSDFTVVKYKSQVVQGMNYVMKIHVGGDKYVHVHVFKPLHHTGMAPLVMSCMKNKSLGDLL